MPRIYYTTSSTGLSSFTGNTNYNEKVSLTFTPTANKTYAIFWSTVLSGSSITNVNNIRLRKTTGTPEIYQEFEIDRDELLEEQSLTDFSLYTAPASPTQESFAIEGRTSVTTDTIYLSDTHITALELSAEDVFVSASASVSTNVNTYATTDSITVGAGDWYIFGSAGVNVNTTTITARGLMGVIISGSDNTSYMEQDSWYSEAVNNWTPYWGMFSASVASSTTYNLQYKDNSAGSTSLRYRKLLALKKSGFYESYFTGSYALSTTGLTEATKVTLTATPILSGNTLVLSTWMMEPPGEVSTQAFSNLLKDNTTVFDHAGELLLEPQSIYDLFQEGYARVYNLPTSQVTWALRFRSTSGAFITGMKNAAILMLALDEPAAPIGGTGVLARISTTGDGSIFRISQNQIGSFVRGS